MTENEMPHACEHGAPLEIGVESEGRAVYDDGCAWVKPAAETDLVTELRSRCRSAGHESPPCNCYWAQAADEIERLRTALREYGQHKRDCTSQNPYARNERGGNDDTCTCGYEAALAQEGGE